jgi:hypothetical protein
VLMRYQLIICMIWHLLSQLLQLRAHAFCLQIPPGVCCRAPQPLLLLSPALQDLLRT